MWWAPHFCVADYTTATDIPWKYWDTDLGMPIAFLLITISHATQSRGKDDELSKRVCQKD